MIDDEIVWRDGSKRFTGFSLRKNGKPGGYDVFGLLGYGANEIWVKAGYIVLKGRDLSGVVSVCQLFMFPMVFVLPLFLRLIWL